MVIITPEQAAERFSPHFKGRMGRLLFNAAAHLTGIAKTNALHDRVDTAGVPYGPPFAKGLLDDLGIDFRIGNGTFFIVGFQGHVEAFGYGGVARVNRVIDYVAVHLFADVFPAHLFFVHSV